MTLPSIAALHKALRRPKGELPKCAVASSPDSTRVTKSLTEQWRGFLMDTPDDLQPVHVLRDEGVPR